MEQRRFASLVLVSQQFRLRDICRITGHRIGESSEEDVDDTQYYYTLHKNADPEPLFTSKRCPRVGEKLPPLGDDQQQRTKTVAWPDVKKDFEQDSPRQSVVVRLWRTAGEGENENKLLICYGIHFSGLVPYSEHLQPRLKANSIVLHTRTGKSFICPRSIDWKQEIGDDSPKDVSAGAAEDTEAQVADESTAGSITGLSPDDNTSPFLKYTSIQVPTPTLQSCCTLDQLLRLQQGQLRLKYKRELLRSLIMEIQSKSAICMTEEMLQRNPLSFVQHHFHHRPNSHSHHHHNHHHAQGSMGKTLTRLLNMEPEPADPKTLIEGHKLSKQIEAVRVRCRLLAVERDRAKRHVDALERKRAVNCDTNVETDSAIMASYHAMSKEKEQYLHLKLTLTKDLETMASKSSDWRLRKQTLLRELCEIYDVKEHSGGHYTINGISLPDAEAYENTHVPAMSISVALGYVSHLVLIVSNVLAVPLRNPIIFKGSQSQISGQMQILNTNV